MAEAPTFEFLSFIQSQLATMDGPIEILEVGGGGATYVDHPNARHTVLELTDDTINRSHYAQERLLGDAQSFDYGQREFDVVVFWNVLEHIARPSDAVLRAASALKPEGLLVIRGPNLRALKSLVTRLTPHRVHVAFYRRVLGEPNAGKPGYAPFPVEHSKDADFDRLEDQIVSRGFKQLFIQHYSGDQVRLLKDYSTVGYSIYSALSFLVRAVTMRRWGQPETEFVAVFGR